MNWEKLMEKYDKKDVLSWMRIFSDQMIESFYIGKKFNPKKRKIDKIIACGMGGSGVGGAILRDLLKDELKIPFEVFSSYELPAYVDRKTLVFAISFSGNTEETLACFKQAKRKGAYVISITTGGKLAKMSKRDLIKIPKSIPQPRMAIAYLCIPMVIALEKMKLIKRKNKELNEAVFLLKKEQNRIEEEAKDLALKMHKKLPVIYVSEELKTVSYRFRTELNENAKHFALNHFLSEHNHNEINAKNGLTRGNSEIFLLRHCRESKKVAKRFGITKKVMGKHYKITEVKLKGKSLIAITFYALQTAALTGYFLALLNHIDPEPVPVISYLKKALKK